jgi:flagellin FlaB
MVKFHNDNEAFTGLEAAMVLIAFVVVAAVFSYAMLGVGFFSTQKSQQVIQAGIAQTSGNIAVKGVVYGISNNDTTAIEKIQFDIGPAIAGTTVDYSRLSFTWSTNSATPVRMNFTSSDPVPGQWGLLYGNSGVSPGPIESGNQVVTIIVCPPVPVFPNEKFTLEISPDSGAPTDLSRTVPAFLTRALLLY